MPQSGFVLASSLVVTNTAITSNGTHTLWTSPSQTNSTQLPGLRVIIDYEQAFAPDPGPAPLSYGITALVESQSDSKWFPVAYQYEEFKNPYAGRQRIIILQPEIATFDAGIDDVMYVSGENIARISRQQGRVGSVFRVRLIVAENNVGGPGSFQSLKFSCHGELYGS